jgi:hypothetical protein
MQRVVADPPPDELAAALVELDVDPPPEELDIDELPPLPKERPEPHAESRARATARHGHQGFRYIDRIEFLQVRLDLHGGRPPALLVAKTKQCHLATLAEAAIAHPPGIRSSRGEVTPISHPL